MQRKKVLKDKPAISKLYVDLGAADKKEAEKIVSIGDTASFVGGFVKCGDMLFQRLLTTESAVRF